MVPVLSTGPDGLKERCKAQHAQTALHRLALKKIGEKLEAVAKTQTLALKSRLDKIQHRQEGLKHRISSLNQLALLMAQRGAPLRPEEEELHRQLKEIQSKMMSPDDFDKFKKQIQLLLQEQSDYIDTLTANYKANPSNFNKDAKAAIKETIEINTRALDALKVQLAGGLQLDKYFRKNGKFLPGAT
ncbi:Nucleoporin nup57 [Massospora cicadina]|nr:Nucleoporin nup57 [Massospora cicadina]